MNRQRSQRIASRVLPFLVLAAVVGCRSTRHDFEGVEAPAALATPTEPAPPGGVQPAQPPREQGTEPSAPPPDGAPEAAPAPAGDVAVPPAGGVSPPAEEEYRNLHHRFSLSVGASVLRRFDTTLQVTSTDVGAGAILDLEDLLNLDESATVLRLDAQYAFNERHGIDLTYYDIDRSGSVELQEDIVVGDVTIPAGAVSTEFGTEIIKATYRYNFVRDVRTVIGLAAGFHYMRLGFDIRSDIGTEVSETVNANLPVPVLGLHGAYALSPKWKLYASAELLQIDIGEFRGLLRDTRLGIEHDTFKNFGWGLGFNGFNVDATIEDDDLTAEVEYSFQGLMLYLRGYV